MDLDLLFLTRTRSKEPKSLWPLSNRSDLESSVIATHIELILIVTGAATATMLSQFFAPLPVLRLIYAEAPTDGVSVALARHWGLLIFCVGALLIYAAFNPPVRVPILVFAVIEKVGVGVCVLGTSLRRQGIAAVLVAGDLLMALVYILYLWASRTNRMTPMQSSRMFSVGRINGARGTGMLEKIVSKSCPYIGPKSNIRRFRFALTIRGDPTERGMSVRRRVGVRRFLLHFSPLKLEVNMNPIMRRGFFALWSILFLLAPASVRAAEPQQPIKQKTSDEELVKQSQNPVADLISVPFQYNFNFAAGPKHNHQILLLNVQPVIPIHMTENWNLITRTIMPIINLPSLAPGIGSATGLGDINPTFFLSPAKPGEWIWGVGPTFTLPTATDKLLGAGKFSLGPAAVVLTMQGHWVLGALMNNQWSVAGWGSGHVNQLLLQPFVNYNLPDHWYLVSGPVMTANWAAKGSDVWTVPLGGGVGKLLKLGQILPLGDREIAKVPFTTEIQAYGVVARPDDGAKWQLRFQLSFLFPD